MSDNSTQLPSKKISQQLRSWYAGGQKGITTVCSTEGVPQPVVDAVVRWYVQGYARFDAIIKELEKTE